MRLTDDQIKMARITYTKVVQDDFILDLIDTIEALQQENERLADETIKLMKENAKNSNKKDELVKVLKQAREAIKAAWSDGSANAAMDKASEALAAIDKAIGGKEDV